MTLSKQPVHCKPPRDSLNPYRVGMSLIGKRFLWDLSLSSWVNRRKLLKLKRKHKGQKAVIVCNGPSLNEVDFSKLENVFTFGLNKVNLLFEDTSFRPSAIVAVNPLVIEQNASFFSTTDIPLFLDTKARKLLSSLTEETTLLHSTDFSFFSRDCSLSVFQGFTVTYVALQLAYHMGFQKVALIGCDHDYYMQGKPNEITYHQYKDEGHFCKHYFASQEPWQFPDLRGSEHAYDLARRAYEAEGRAIVNASSRTQLDVFQKVDLESFLSDDI